LQEHDQFLRHCLSLTQGRLIDKADGVLALFERPIQALDFSLRYQQQMRVWSKQYQHSIQARIGIHVGDVMTWQNEPDQINAGAKPLEVEGLAKPIAARLMGLAMPGQILMSGMAQSLAQRAQLELGERGQNLRWLVHGRYQFKGVPAPMLVHEVGDPEFSPLRAPVSTQKAWRDIPLWRRPPVVALEVLLSIGLIGGFLYSTFQSPPAIAFYERDWVVLADVQNRSNEILFNDSLDTAMRIGLEQSAYVNVISESQEQEALKRMKREGQSIDRQTGTELALRENAKALVLPTLTQVGGRLRVTAEVIDPNTGVTVYTESADAKNASSVLPALDDVLEKIRTRLGESVSLIDKSSKPLDQVTTSSLEALRAFSLGIEARLDGDNIQAMTFFEHAVKLDPDFAMAYIRLALIMYSQNNMDEAERYLSVADKKRQRLSNRESLLLDASLSIFKPPNDMLIKLKTLAKMYPDEYRAYYNFAFFSINSTQQYESAKKFLGPAFSTHNPDIGGAYYQLGSANLALNKYDDAITAFKQYESQGIGRYNRDYADTYAAQRDFVKAESILATQKPNSDNSFNIEKRMPEITYPLDQGQWQKALHAVKALSSEISNPESLDQASLHGIDLSLRSYNPDEAFIKDLHQYLYNKKLLLKDANILERRHLIFQILSAGWMMAKNGHSIEAHQALKSVDEYVHKDGYPANTDMYLVLQARIDLVAENPVAAIDKLEKRSKNSDVLYFLHVELMHSYASNKDFSRALEQAEWVIQNRGLAYAEYNSLNMWQPVNIIENNLALLAAAGYSKKLGFDEKSIKYLHRLRLVWPETDLQPQVIHRMSELN
jgi:putative peptide modification system cyclase